jgi:multiple sugar transport system ATP-binding protein
VGKFIGSPSMNVIPGVVARRPAGIAFVCEAGEVPLGRSRDLNEGRRVLMGVRPHDVKISLDDGRGDFTMRIDLVQLIGAEKHVELSGKDGVSMAARVDAEARVVAGDTVGCAVAADAVHLFDEGTGVRLAD